MAILCTALALLSAPARAQVIQSNGSGPWNLTTTWIRLSGSGTLPNSGDHVIVQSGHQVVLNTNAGIGDLAHLDVRGTLLVQDSQNYALGASRIDVGASGASSAVFRAGTVAAPFMHDLTITLTGNHLSGSYMAPLENKSFVVHGGATLDLHGNPLGPGGAARVSWLRLQGNLAAGVTQMALESPPGWAVGDRFVIASTDFDMNQAEVRAVTAVTGSVVSFTPALGFAHHGTVELGLVDERAEVGLLSRNIVVQGDTASASSRRGGHLMFLSGPAGPPSIGISWTEFTALGWHGALGRYPIHFHQVGPATGSFVVDSSVHGCFNRAITIHGTDQVFLEDNVAYDTWGHGYFLEDGNERQNGLYHNLGLVNRRPDPSFAGVGALGASWNPGGGAASPFFLASDAQPSTFWITNTDNTLHGNAAAGSEGHGFWYDIANPQLPFNWLTPVRFEENVAHSNTLHGFFQESARMFALDGSQPNPVDVAHVFADFTAYKNREAAVWHRCYGMSRWLRARVADNQFGFYLASEGYQQDYQSYLTPYLGPPYNLSYHAYFLTGAPGLSVQTLEDCAIVGETQNRGNPTMPVEFAWTPQPRSLPRPDRPEFMLKGVELYDGLIGILGCDFYDFRDAPLPSPVSPPGGTFTHRASAAVTTRGQHSVNVPGNPWAVDPRNLIASSTFTGVDHPVLFPLPHQPTQTWGENGGASAALYDIDGSVQPGFSAGTYFANNTPLLRPAGFGGPMALPNLPQYALPLAIPGPGTPADFALAQLLLTIGGAGNPWSAWNQNPDFALEPYVQVTSVTRPGQTLGVYDGERSANPFLRRYPANVLLASPAGTLEEYALAYPPGHAPSSDARNLEVRLKFSAPDRTCLLILPYGAPGGGPSSVFFTNEMIRPSGVNGTPVGSAAAVRAGSGYDYFYDQPNGRLYIRPTVLNRALLQPFLPWLGPALLTILDGREVVVEIRG